MTLGDSARLESRRLALVPYNQYKNRNWPRIRGKILSGAVDEWANALHQASVSSFGSARNNSKKRQPERFLATGPGPDTGPSRMYE